MILLDGEQAGFAALLIVLGSIFIIIALVVFIAASNDKKNKIVEERSTYLKQIKETNARFQFALVEESSASATFHLNSKKQFNYFDAGKKGAQYLLENKDVYLPILDAIRKNKELYPEYLKEIDAIKHTEDQQIIKSSHMSLKSFFRRESKLGLKYIKHPTKDFTFKIIWDYESPSGRNFYKDEYVFSFEQAQEILHRKDKKDSAKKTIDEPIITLDDIEDLE